MQRSVRDDTPAFIVVSTNKIRTVLSKNAQARIYPSDRERTAMTELACSRSFVALLSCHITQKHRLIPRYQRQQRCFGRERILDLSRRQAPGLDLSLHLLDKSFQPHRDES